MPTSPQPLAHRVVGTGAPVVLIHGWGADSRIWDPTSRSLAASRQVWLPDLPGHGATPLDAPGQNFNDHCCESLSAWLHAHGLASSPLVAWAWGARLVIDMVARGLVQPVSVFAVALPPPADVPDPYSGPLWRDHARYMRSIARMMTADPVSPERERWFTHLMTHTSVAASGGSHAQPWVPPDTSFKLPPRSIAVLGAGDRIGNAREAAALFAGWGGDTEVWDDCGHLPFVEQPGRFNDRIQRWLGEIGEARHDLAS